MLKYSVNKKNLKQGNAEAAEALSSSCLLSLGNINIFLIFSANVWQTPVGEKEVGIKFFSHIVSRKVLKDICG